MKRIVLSLFIFTFIIGVFATNVDLKDASSIALNAYFQKVNTYYKNVNFKDLEVVNHFVINQNGECVIYAFNFRDYGYILIAADDAIEPVLGYAFESQYSLENQPENLKGLVWQFGEHILYLKNNKIAASQEISQQWSDLLNFNAASFSPEKSGKDIEPLLTCTWDQVNPYNYFCPPRTSQPNSQGKALVGCVATAMSQIMLYWRYPHQGSGSHSYNCPPVGTLSANFGETIYDWDGMLDNSVKVNLPMALIGFHAGVSVDMDYFDANGSGAYSDDVPYAMKTYFNYANGINFKQRSFYQLTTWKTMVQTELNANRPVYYSGQSPDGGHAFVLDGYHQADDTYHFNFGWSGSGNGWFSITNAGGFTSNQGMVSNIMPGDANYPYGCTPDFVTTDLVGSLTDGSGPQENYDQNANCSWLIDPQTANDSVTKIQLSFVVLDTESDDIITIYDGETTSAPVLGTYSGNPATMPPAVLSTGNKMLIVFTADGDATTASGFRVEYFTYLPAWCSGNTILNSTSGVLDDGSGSWYYKNQTNCTWKIQPEWASDLTLTFTEFDTEEDLDVVKIYDASNNQLLATYSGQYTPGDMPEPITVPSGKIFISFQSDGAVNRPGWTAEWEIANTSVEDQVAGFDHLMVYPNPAENLLNISFKVEENQSLEVRLISATGTVVYSEDAKDFAGYYVNTIDLSNLAKGIYFLSLTNDNGTVNKKVVIK